MGPSISGQPISPAATADSTRAGPAPSKLTKAAREFEAILLQNWLEKMNKSFVGDEQSQDAAHDTVTSLGTQAISTALAARGGIGIASMILRQLQPKIQPATAGEPQVQPNPGIHSGRANGR